jgi:fucose permease
MTTTGDRTLLRILTYLMFAMFAMTTDSVGVIIPHVIERFGLGMTAGGAFHYATMGGIAIAAIGLGFLADRMGRKATIVIGLVLFGVSSALFAVGQDFLFFVGLLFVGGLGIGVFKSGALALIGDISTSTRQHSATMNTVEGFFGVGAIAGPAIVAILLQSGTDWKWLYVVAAVMCGGLILAASLARYPAHPARAAKRPASVGESLKLLGDPHTLGFGLALMLYVAAEAAVYVWAPTYLAGYEGDWTWFAVYAVSIFFVLRAAVLADGPGHLHDRHVPVLRRRRPGRSGGSGAGPARLGSVHVGALSDDQLQGHQLFREGQTWPDRRPPAVPDLCQRRPGPAGDGLARRCLP